MVQELDPDLQAGGIGWLDAEPRGRSSEAMLFIILTSAAGQG